MKKLYVMIKQVLSGQKRVDDTVCLANKLYIAKVYQVSSIIRIDLKEL